MNLRSQVLACGILLATAVPAATAQVESINLWNSGIGSYATYRVPGIVTTKRGVMLAYCGGRKDLSRGDWSPTDILLRRSLDGGRTWSPSRKIAGNGSDLTDNVVAIVDRQTGDVYFLYQKGYSSVYEIRSDDDGKTFSQEVDITAAFDEFKTEFPWNVIAPGTGHGIQLRNGRLIASIWMANGAVKADGTRRHAPAADATIYSDDHGRSWHRGAIVARDSPEMPSPNESVVAQLASGTVMMNIRTGGTRHLRVVSRSKTGISGWSTPHYDAVLFDPTCDAGLLSVPASAHHAAVLYFSNPDSRNVADHPTLGMRARENLTIKMSEDDGETWSHERVIDPGVSGYSDMTAQGGNLFVLYESGSLHGSESTPDHVTLARVKLAWISLGDRPQPSDRGKGGKTPELILR